MTKNGLFRPAGGGTIFRVRDRVTSVSNRSYVVDSKPGVRLDKRPIRLRQGGRYHFFFTNMLLSEQHVGEKEKKYHAAAGEICRYRVKRPV